MLDDDYVSSEVYRLMPPRGKPSQVRQALDALNGNGPEPGIVVPEAKQPRLHTSGIRGAALRWFGNLTTLTLAGVLATLIGIWLVHLF